MGLAVATAERLYATMLRPDGPDAVSLLGAGASLESGIPSPQIWSSRRTSDLWPSRGRGFQARVTAPLGHHPRGRRFPYHPSVSGPRSFRRLPGTTRWHPLLAC